MQDFRSRYELAMAWLYQQFIIEESKAPRSSTRRDSRYNRILTDMLSELQKTLDPRDKYVCLNCTLSNVFNVSIGSNFNGIVFYCL